ncbi:Type I restriction-modification system specificity subunit S [Lactococcus lactis subsp. lactis]|uniref:restriction endonuclease subunit S n=2 Tax=Lactococcus TaxID=1357 RepID=UPI00071DB4DA|nr:restriction endonuclease subunit S [Lactococcus lactis]KST93220.1 Type I restriction-modification system specificity subunit S [Lactococcus lactis subsp. lactis]
MAKIDDSVKKKVPELRFKGFTDDWEERKLIEVADYRNGKAHEKDISEAGDYIVVNSKFVSTNGLVKKYSDEMIAPLSKNEIAFVLSDVPNGRAIARTFLISEENKYSLNQRIAGITPHADTNSYFLHSLMNRNHYFLRFDDGVSQTNLSKKEVEKWVELYPSYGEQQKIGSFFKQLDDTIALHQRKLDLLKEQKKGYLQKMFPKNGEKVPELRFAGFADDWEERKLGDLSQDTIGGGTPKTSVTEFWNGEIPWIQSSDLANDKLYGVLPKKFITEDAVKNSATKLIPANSIAIVTRVGVGKLAFMPYEFASSQDFLSLSNLQVDCNFGMYSIYKMLQRELNNIQGTSIKGITKADLLDKETFVPIKVEEQQKIGSFFKQLDDTIALHQRKLDLLKEQKKGFLQKMFI